MSKYFDQFPEITYGKKVAKNITVRMKFRETVFERYNSFYPYKIKEGERPDMLAFNYYGESSAVWLIFLANNIIDPYHDWPLTERQLIRKAVDKYGTVEAADDLASPAYYLVSDPDVSGVSYRASADSYRQSYDGDNFGKEGAHSPKGNKNNYTYKKLYLDADGNDVAATNVQGVTNWARMRSENEDRRTIQLLDRKFYRMAKNELKDLMKDG